MTNEEFTKHSNSFTDLIVNSNHPRKIILAGAGCGKSFTFKKILIKNSSNPSDSLAITFINALSTDLRAKLGEHADARTFHSLAKMLYMRTGGADGETFSGLEHIIDKDYQIIKDPSTKIDFSKLFRNFEKNEAIDFFLERGDYYKAYYHEDIVYRAVVLAEEINSPLANYKVAVVDEYQDFNQLEAVFLEKAIKAEQLILAGDDDQAIYDFRSSPDIIRKKAADNSYKVFNLPYCFRCTEIIVKEVKTIIEKAKENGFLSSRLEKDYLTFSPIKAQDSNNFPKIIHAKCSMFTKKCPYVARFIADEIKKITTLEIDEAKEKGYFDVLIIGASQYLLQVSNYFKLMGIKHEYKPREEPDFYDHLLLALTKLLRLDADSNLGWRIIVEHEKPSSFEEIIKKTSNGITLSSLLEQSYKEKYLNIIQTLISVVNKESVDNDRWKKLEDIIAIPKSQIEERLIKKKEATTEQEENNLPTIKLTTHVGSKGLSGGRVFIISFNDGDFPHNPSKITENEINMLIVDITRTVKQCYLLSNWRFGANYGMRESTFINWFDRDAIKTIEVNKKYFEQK